METQKSSSTAIVRLDSVRKVYGKGANSVTALADLSLEFEKGTFTAVMGPSGSGKSTMLHCAAGLDQPTSGTVVLDDVDLGKLNEKKLTLLRRRRIGFIFQSLNLLPALTAEQNVTLPLQLAGTKPDRAAVEDALAQVGLADRRHHRPTELSGGQQQRVAVARALITRPAVIFADEPTGALDTRSGRSVLTLLRNAVRNHQHTIVMVTHDPSAASYADRVVFLADGQIDSELRNPTAETVAERMTMLGAWADKDAVGSSSFGGV
ncbi:ABC transporter ATP-binding protein [Actinosynnema sp. NPDC002837]